MHEVFPFPTSPSSMLMSSTITEIKRIGVIVFCSNYLIINYIIIFVTIFTRSFYK